MSQRSRFAYCLQMESDAKAYIAEKASDLSGLLNGQHDTTGQDMLWDAEVQNTLDQICEWWLGPGTILRADEKQFRNQKDWKEKQKQKNAVMTEQEAVNFEEAQSLAADAARVAPGAVGAATYVDSSGVRHHLRVAVTGSDGVAEFPA